MQENEMQHAISLTQYAPRTTGHAFRLELHIDELVLHGFEHLDRVELGTEVQRALGQLFAERGMPASLNQGGHVDALDGGTFLVQADAGVGDIAGQIAQAIYRGFGS